MIKKEIPIRMNLACIPIRRKEYKGYGMLFYFMLEEHTEMGSVPVIKFARLVASRGPMFHSLQRESG